MGITGSIQDPLNLLQQHTPSPRRQSGAIDLSRRRFLVLSGMSGLALALVGCDGAAQSEASANSVETINQYIQIDTDGSIILFSPHPEIGQGVRTSLPMILAEELDADWNDVVVRSAEIDVRRYGLQYAGGSTSVIRRYPELRNLGAAARHMLLEAAAQSLDVPTAELTTKPSRVIHEPTGRALTYGSLAAKAATLPPPAEDSLTYKDPANYRLLGQRITSVDNDAIVRGEPLFGIDTVRPGVLFATYVKCPSVGGSPKTANLDDIKALPGIADAFILEGMGGLPSYSPTSHIVAPGVAIVARSTWQALKARNSLKVEWDLSGASTDDSDLIADRARQLVETEAGPVASETGDVDGAYSSAHQTIDAYYQADFACHAQLEPNSCVADYRDGAVEVWAPTQTPVATVAGLMIVLGHAQPEDDPQQVVGAALTSGKVIVHQIRAGGGFGRRLENDYAREAALISRKVGAPVKLQWTREDDMAFDYFRPPMFVGLKAALTKHGTVSAWETRQVSVSADGETPNRDSQPEEVFLAQATVPNIRVVNPLVASKTPTGPMRAPGSNTFAFAEQSFIHELAVAAGRDHVDFLIDMLGERRWLEDGNPLALNTARAIDVIQSVAARAGWGKDMPDGRALGLSFYFSHAGHVAEIADVSVTADKAVTIHKVWVVSDIGPVINLSGAESQVEGSVIDAISTLAAQRVTFKNGAAQQSNYDTYPLLRVDRTPKIDVHFIETPTIPSGIGEPALPPLAGAVCNAIYAATGERIRRLPISEAGFRL